ncbi:MAG TPA: glutathione S-transferase family protein [Caulobacteraceae bacterium]|jgi:glutathione S-transferase
MIVYGSTLSPFVRKTLAYISEKGLSAELKPIRLQDPEPDFRAASPFGKMPGFRDGDFAISDSTAIITYLEALHPDPPMLPAEPKARARTIWYEEFADTILTAAGGAVFFNRVVAPMFLGRPGDVAAAEKAEKEDLPPILDYIERTIPDSGYLVEDRLTLADLAVASPFVNLEHCGITVDAAKYPKTAAYVGRIHARPSFAPMIAQEKQFFAR